MIVMDAGALEAFIAAEFPQVSGYRLMRVDETGVTMRLDVQHRHLRPGGTVSGPTMFELADLAMYAALLSRIGPVALSVTTGASIDFMRKPAAGRAMTGECRLLKLGRTLAVGDVLIRSEGAEEVVARASLTYAIPPKR
ncbi:PaaI family thioesterase [Paracoccus endophyticus]|uniref:PaaI family thioesterase n=1 Tax=Paracoccus endophyticus TaxID=2233774 RepID=UPI000DD57935|nr:PaaI family thioesterase [Paracoccus endophyticus]